MPDSQLLAWQAGEVVSVKVQHQEASNNRFGFITFGSLVRAAAATALNSHSRAFITLLAVVAEQLINQGVVLASTRHGSAACCAVSYQQQLPTLLRFTTHWLMSCRPPEALMLTCAAGVSASTHHRNAASIATVHPVIMSCRMML